MIKAKYMDLRVPIYRIWHLIFIDGGYL